MIQWGHILVSENKEMFSENIILYCDLVFVAQREWKQLFLASSRWKVRDITMRKGTWGWGGGPVVISLAMPVHWTQVQTLTTHGRCLGSQCSGGRDRTAPW